MPEKELLLNDIRNFVGKYKKVPFDYDYRPVFNIKTLDQNTVTPRVGLPYPLESLEVPQLKDLIVELFRYSRFCDIRGKKPTVFYQFA